MNEILKFLCSTDFFVGFSVWLAVLFLTGVGVVDFVTKTPRTFFTKLFGININYTDPKIQKENRWCLAASLLCTLIFAACEPLGKGLNWYNFLARSAFDALMIYIVTRVLIFLFLLPIMWIYPQNVYYKRKKDGVYRGTIIDPFEGGICQISAKKKLTNLQLIDGYLDNKGDWGKTARYCIEHSNNLPYKPEWSYQTPFTITYIPFPPIQEEEGAELQLGKEVIVVMLFGETAVFIPEYRL